MDKILVDVRVPAIERNFDIWVPVESNLEEVKLLISATIEALYGECFKMQEKSIICSIDRNMVYPRGANLLQLGIQNGERLVLI